jgi:hypothetical protein
MSVSNRPMQVYYLATNRFPTVTEVQAMPEYSSAEKFYSIARQPPHILEASKPIWFWVAAGCITATAVVVIWVMKGKQKQQKPSIIR